MSADPIEAVRAMRERGISNPEELLERAEPDRIVWACREFDDLKQKTKVGPGLLAKWIREGGRDEPPTGAGPRLRTAHAEYALRFPVGSVVEPHARLQQRRRYDDEPCAGSMIVLTHDYPNWMVECDRCLFLAALPCSALALVLDLRLVSVAA